MNGMRGAWALAALVALAARTDADAASPPPAAAAPCVQVRIGEDVAGRLDCLNQALRQAAAGAHAAATPQRSPAAALDPLQLGQPNPAALRQRYGNAYGRSLSPQRPLRHYPVSSFAPAR